MTRVLSLQEAAERCGVRDLPKLELKPKLPEAVREWTDCSVRVPLRDVVSTEAGALPYWRLVVALGAQPDFAPGGMTFSRIRTMP